MIVATAGHIDHGKTALVQALTGIDTDRLPEEKARGMTIDLGFAYRPLDDGPVMGFVDVPGHERFVRNMVAGVAGIDLALLVVAADDGPMAQTREHLAILDLLAIDDGAVALTKIDLADGERLAAVEADIASMLAGTGLEGAPIFRTSALTGDGIDALRDHLEAAARRRQRRRTGGDFRLAIDRRFIVEGAGLVVTGTAFAGRIHVDDRLVVSPGGTPVRVRRIHAQNERSDIGRAGQRLGINIAGQGLNRAGVHRGDWLLAADLHAPTRRLDARVRMLSGEARPLRHLAPVHVHLGAAEVTGRAAVLGERAIAPGADGLVQLMLDADIGALAGDRFILRDAAAQRTIGGGRVIDPFAPSRGRVRPDRLAMLAAMETDDAGAALAAQLALDTLGIDETRFRIARNVTADDMKRLIEAASAVRLPVAGGAVLYSGSAVTSVRDRVVACLDAAHEASPELPGLPEQSLRKQVNARFSPAAFRAHIDRLVAAGEVVRVGAHVARPGHRAQMPEMDEALWLKIADILEADPFRPPVVHAIAGELGRPPRDIERFMGRAARLGYLYRIARNRFVLREAMGELARLAEGAATDAGGQLSIPAFREATGVGRNLAVELLEFFDKAGLTARDGDTRRMLAPSSRIFPTGQT